ncbi:glycosyltransferase family 2 protein [Phaeobacter sp. QD34_3]|uniref:glycosyltransferase family 2 protein n=1 Tax=unclassified Phaeobacter TaxID=2621772 RepID=UPI00237F90EC|nr:MULTISPECIES: glycosyltransferase family 2 protein [unclassified Phaeobacter]MDE4133569.1 glycosyltransferase family 2 protein [Phaeobacter sp. QD34_3]MDE4137205.1 glycosyltransferase family 2 protein [Phaeobacter sp. QD34_24]MDE4174029.1 glycosyltransferase family 2 protein [Phaeobacter sp. PT47_59]
MRTSADRWGIVATVKAPAADILNWAAYHIEAGAHRLFIYLDAPCPEARDLLARHPKIRIFDCDEAYWAQRRKGGKPEKHQVRQTMNATRAYRRQTKGLDWLIHMDVDEFLWSETDLGEVLGALPETAHCARAYPIEALAGGDGTAFKSHIAAGANQLSIAERVYPTYGEYLSGGFLSHSQGKLFVRPGLEQAQFRIHNIYTEQGENPGQAILNGVDLCHLHAADWDAWIAHYRYRLEKGAYRSELKPIRPRHQGGVTLHDLLSAIEEDPGTAGLKAFFEEVCADTPALRARLQAEGLLCLRDLQLEDKRQKQFPEFGQRLF